jgi:hypothetical protein
MMAFVPAITVWPHMAFSGLLNGFQFHVFFTTRDANLPSKQVLALTKGLLQS